jgi:hypothetical protein
MTQAATLLFGIATGLCFATMFFVIRMVRECLRHSILWCEGGA